LPERFIGKAGPLQAALVLEFRRRRPAGAGDRIGRHKPPAATIGNACHFGLRTVNAGLHRIFVHQQPAVLRNQPLPAHGRLQGPGLTD